MGEPLEPGLQGSRFESQNEVFKGIVLRSSFVFDALPYFLKDLNLGLDQAAAPFQRKAAKKEKFGEEFHPYFPRVPGRAMQPFEKGLFSLWGKGEDTLRRAGFLRFNAGFKKASGF